MLEYNNQLIEIIKWDKYNPRKDLKATSWVRLQNSLFGDPEFIEFNHSELLFWIYLLSVASQKQVGSIHFKQRHAEEVGRFSKQDIHSAIKKLVEMNCIKVSGATPVKATETTLHARDVDVTQTLHARDADDTLRTNERNERNERNVTNERNVKLVGIRTDYPQEFQTMWDAYGKRGDKKAAYKEFKKLSLDSTQLSELQKAISNYVGSTPDSQYRKHMERFLQSDWRELIHAAPIRNNQRPEKAANGRWLTNEEKKRQNTELAVVELMQERLSQSHGESGE